MRRFINEDILEDNVLWYQKTSDGGKAPDVIDTPTGINLLQIGATP